MFFLVLLDSVAGAVEALVGAVFDRLGESILAGPAGLSLEVVGDGSARAADLAAAVETLVATVFDGFGEGVLEGPADHTRDGSADGSAGGADVAGVAVGVRVHGKYLFR